MEMSSNANSTSSASSSASAKTFRKVANTILVAKDMIHIQMQDGINDQVLTPISNNVLQPFADNVNDIIARTDKSIAIAPKWLTNEQDPFYTAMSCTGFFHRLVYGAAMRYMYGIGLQLKIVDTFLNTLSLINALIVTIPFSVMSIYSYDFWDSLQQTMTAQGCGNRFDRIYNSIRGNINAVLCFALIPLLITALYYIARPSNFGEIAEDETLVKITNTGRLLYQEEGNEVDIDNQTDPVILQRIQVAVQMASLKSKTDPQTQDVTDEDRIRAIITSIVLEARTEQRKDRQNFYFWWQRARIAILIAFATTIGSVMSLFSMAGQIMAYYAVRPTDVCDGAGVEAGFYLAFALPLLLLSLYVLL